MKKLIALTGGIGSGKTTALKIIESLGYTTLSCDDVTRELYKKQSVLRRIKKIIPQAINGKLILKADKTKIAQTIFNDCEKYKEFTEYLTKLTLEKTLKKAYKIKGLVFVEVPLLLEFNATNYFDDVIIITRNKNDRIESVKTRSLLTDEQVFERINSQFDYDNSDLSKYIVISNNQTQEQLKSKIIKVLDKLKTNL